MAGIAGPNFNKNGLIFNIDTFQYDNLNLGAKTIRTYGVEPSLTGTIVGPVTYGTGSGVLQFVSNDEYLTWSANSAWAFGTGDFTIEVWIYPISFSTYTHMVALPDQNTFALKANVTDGAIYFYSPTFTTYPTAGWNLTLNQWNHVVFRRQSGTAFMDLNGANIGSLGSFNNNFTSQILNIHNGQPGEFANCRIRSVRIYNRSLSTDEVYENYIAFQSRVFQSVTFPALTTTLDVANQTATAGAVLSYRPVSFTGGYGVKTLTLSGAALPTGLSFDASTGFITGTATVVQSSTSRTITITDTIGQTSSRSFNLTVSAPALTSSLNISSPLSVNTGVTLLLFPITVNGGFGTITYSISNFPAAAGASINSSTGELTINPTTTFSLTTVTVSAQDQASQTTSQNFNIQTNPQLYSFGSFTFSSPLEGQTGPTLAQLTASYNTVANPWLTNTAYFNVSVQGIQEWTVPATATYQIQARGASGGIHEGSYFPAFPGAGAQVQGNVNLTQGTVVYIVVGQKPSSTTTSNGGQGNGSGGGGGSFVYTGASASAGIGGGGLIIAAGGGGGTGHGSSTTTGGNGVGGSSTTNSNEATPGSTFGINPRQGNGSVGNNGIGQGGLATSTSQAGGTSGGAGWLSNGANTTLTSGNTGGLRFVGGTSEDGATQHGGFGGGGPAGGSGNAGGGGGGYTGGGAGGGWTNVYWGGGGGGGSFCIGSAANQVFTQGNSGINYNDTANGFVTITKL